ncbi:hypothetical protein [Phormidium sp. CCY1219]|nr:hypothetical protein [Phormidium sp. CCY1219]
MGVTPHLRRDCRRSPLHWRYNPIIIPPSTEAVHPPPRFPWKCPID